MAHTTYQALFCDKVTQDFSPSEEADRARIREVLGPFITLDVRRVQALQHAGDSTANLGSFIYYWLDGLKCHYKSKLTPEQRERADQLLCSLPQ